MTDLIRALADELGISDDDARAIVEAATPLWNTLARLGWVDEFGGAESRRVLVSALSHIHREANQGPAPAEWN